ncbi:MAG: acyl-CoA dehydrogenase family protein [Actinomycetota bacterium]
MVSSVLEQARALGPTIAARSDDVERNRTLPLDLVDAIRPSQAFRQWVPADLDGPAITAWEGLQVIEEFAYHDGSTGWCVAISGTSSLLASYLPDDWAKTIFGDTRSITGGFAQPLGRATPVDGGLRVSGQWQWGSGTQHATWVGGGCRVVDADGQPSKRGDGLVVPYVFFDLDDVEFIDTWQVSGLQGTGSVDYAVTEAFVPEGRWAQLGVDPPVRDGALTRFSFFGLLALGIAATAVGIARRSIDELVVLAADKRPQGSSRPLRDRASVQADVAIAEAKLRSAWGFVERSVEEAWAVADGGGTPSDEDRRVLRMAATHATQTAAEVAEAMYKAAGGAAVYRTSPIQRCFRDAFVATQHAMVAPRTFEVTGRMRLGLETDTRTL